MTNIIPRLSEYILIEAGDRPATALQLAEQLKIDPAMVTPPGQNETNPDYDAGLVAYLEDCIDSAVASGEALTRRTFTRSTFQAFLDDFIQGQSYEVRKCPFISMESIERYVSGALVAVSSGDYYVTKSRTFPRVTTVEGKSWPYDADRRQQAVEFNFTAGYGAAPTPGEGEDPLPSVAMPEDLRRAILSHAAALYANRGDCVPGTTARDLIPPCSMSVYNRYRIVDIHVGI